MSPQGIMFSEKASNSPGLCPIKDRNLALAPRQVLRLILEPVFGCHQDLLPVGILHLANYFFFSSSMCMPETSAVNVTVLCVYEHIFLVM
jgi:hypothetical protein